MSDCFTRLVVGILAFRVTGALRWGAAIAVLAMLAGFGHERWTAWELAGERRALEAKAFELVTRTMVPGSTLACLDAAASSAIVAGCERALFASPESTAAAITYVTAQLSLLAAGKDFAQRTGSDTGAALAQLRRNAEWDAFGLVAHVLAAKDGCTANECPALAFLDSSQRVRANLARRAFDANVSRYAAVWANGGREEVAHHAESAEPAVPVAAAVTPATPAPAATPPRTPNNYFFPSADSIPAVSIMTPEPGEAPGDKARPATVEASRKPTGRTSGAVTASAAPNAGTARAPAGPIPLTPAGR